MKIILEHELEKLLKKQLNEQAPPVTNPKPKKPATSPLKPDAEGTFIDPNTGRRYSRGVKLAPGQKRPRRRPEGARCRPGRVRSFRRTLGW
jgi:hypothetical protein